MAKEKPNFVPKNPKRSGPQDNDKSDKKAKGQDSRKVHDTKGKNTHGRNRW